MMIKGGVLNNYKAASFRIKDFIFVVLVSLGLAFLLSAWWERPSTPRKPFRIQVGNRTVETTYWGSEMERGSGR